MSIFSVIAHTALRALGRLGKGKATVAGLVGVALGAGTKHFIGDVVTAENVVQVIQATASMVQALGVVVAAFGFGRKSGWIAADAVTQAATPPR